MSEPNWIRSVQWKLEAIQLSMRVELQGSPGQAMLDQAIPAANTFHDALARTLELPPSALVTEITSAVHPPLAPPPQVSGPELEDGPMWPVPSASSGMLYTSIGVGGGVLVCLFAVLLVNCCVRRRSRANLQNLSVRRPCVQYPKMLLLWRAPRIVAG